jgi:hypothetical protein
MHSNNEGGLFSIIFSMEKEEKKTNVCNALDLPFFFCIYALKNNKKK